MSSFLLTQMRKRQRAGRQAGWRWAGLERDRLSAGEQALSLPCLLQFFCDHHPPTQGQPKAYPGTALSFLLGVWKKYVRWKVCEIQGKRGTSLGLTPVWTHRVTSDKSHVLPKTKVSLSIMRSTMSSVLV